MGDALATYFEAAASAMTKTAEAGVVTEALEKIVEANTLLSGLGFESGGLAAAHAIYNGFTVLDETHKNTHGEKVAYSTFAQMVLENRDPAEINCVLNFCRELGLPTKLADLGIENLTEAKIIKVAEASCVEEETIHNMPFAVDADMVKDAILAVDRL